MFLSGSSEASSIRSLTLWIVALHGPNSMTCGQILAMKRPSDVPPVVDSSAVTPVSSRMALTSASVSEPRGVRKGSPPSSQSSVYSRPWRSSTSCTRAFRPSGVLAVEKRKLNSATASPGTTLVAPVPEFRFETWNVVGGKYSLPWSHSIATISASAGASWCTGLRARCG